MIHTIVSWDCCFRNFHHLIDGLLNQAFPRESFELIFVEQRGREASDRYNHRHGLASLGDRYEKERGKINFKVIYLNDDPGFPYHLGRCNNLGIEVARGSFISVMDGDQLLPSNFLTKLTNAFQANSSAVFCVYRKMAAYPVGVERYGDWLQADTSFQGCLRACPDRFKEPPQVINNYGPMVSASRDLWERTGGYDPSPIWSTFLSTAAADVAKRLSLVGSGKVRYLQDSVVVHPWHPTAPDSLRHDGRGKRFLDLQRELTQFSVRNRLPHHKDRAELREELYERNREFIEDILSIGETIDDLQLQVPSGRVLKEKINCWASQLGARLFRK